MIRKTLTIVSLLGLLLSVGLWGVGHFYSYKGATGSYAFFVQDGLILVSAYPRRNISVRDSGWRRQQRRKPVLQFERPAYWNELPWHDNWHLKLPLWIPTVAFAIGPISFVLLPLHRRRKREKLGLCVKCGYDLRASKDRCPECGEGIESSG